MITWEEKMNWQRGKLNPIVDNLLAGRDYTFPDLTRAFRQAAIRLLASPDPYDRAMAELTLAELATPIQEAR